MEEVKNRNNKACGNHRGCPPPDLEVIEKQAKEYRYDQYENSITHLAELCMMVSMEFPPGLIHDLSSRKLAVCDLDFIRIIYFVLQDEGFIRDCILSKDSYVYEDVLEDAIGEAVKRKYPEFSDAKLAYEKYKRLEKMTDERIRFIDLQNEKLRCEIRSRQEEKQLHKEEAAREIESLKASCADRDDRISILTGQMADLDSERKSLLLEKAELEEDISELTSSLDAARGRASELEDSIKRLKAEQEKQEKGNQDSIRESLDAVSNGINRILAEIGKLEKTGNRRRRWGIFAGEEPESIPAEKPVTVNAGDDFVRSILTDPDLASEQYRLLIYCVEAGLPIEDIRAIADTKVDIERMEFLARWYFRKNKVNFEYEGKAADAARKAQDSSRATGSAAKEGET